jgi:DNA-binding transcriptional LysR family regulator
MGASHRLHAVFHALFGTILEEVTARVIPLLTSNSPQDLLAHNCIVYSELATQNAWTFTSGPRAKKPEGTAVTVRAHGNLQTNSNEVIRASVFLGMGIGYSPTWLFEDELASGEVKVLLPAWPAPPLPVELVSPHRRGSLASRTQ